MATDGSARFDGPRARLTAERERLTTLIEETRGRIEATQDPEGFDDTTTEAAERSEQLILQESLEAERAEIDAALERIANGTYGIDEDTGEPIDPARLEAVPTARTNIRR
jgi:RNA polymerase-binding transcription factor DksA